MNRGRIGRVLADGEAHETRRHGSEHRQAGRPNNHARSLLAKRQVEERTSLDITTIYRKMKAGTFPQPVRVGRRRVAWRESDIAAWQAALEVDVKKSVRQAMIARVATKRR